MFFYSLLSVESETLLVYGSSPTHLCCDSSAFDLVTLMRLAKLQLFRENWTCQIVWQLWLEFGKYLSLSNVCHLDGDRLHIWESFVIHCCFGWVLQTGSGSGCTPLPCHEVNMWFNHQSDDVFYRWRNNPGWLIVPHCVWQYSTWGEIPLKNIG